MSRVKYVEMNFSDRLKAEVDQKFGGNWAELARKTGLKPSTLQQIKKGADPRLSTLRRIADGLEVDLSYLLATEDGNRSAIQETPSLFSPDVPDQRLCELLDWLTVWWQSANTDEKTWFEVEMRRTFPEMQHKENQQPAQEPPRRTDHTYTSKDIDAYRQAEPANRDDAVPVKYSKVWFTTKEEEEAMRERRRKAFQTGDQDLPASRKASKDNNKS